MVKGLRNSLPFEEAIELAEANMIPVVWTRCLRCKESGHLAAECTNPIKPRLCHRCGGADHFLRDCRQLKKVTAVPEEKLQVIVEEAEDEEEVVEVG